MAAAAQALASRLSDATLLRADETELCKLALEAMQNQCGRAMKALAPKKPSARGDGEHAARPYLRHTGAAARRHEGPREACGRRGAASE